MAIVHAVLGDRRSELRIARPVLADDVKELRIGRVEFAIACGKL